MHHLNIRNNRKAANISQKELAQRVGISTSYLNLIESGKRQLSDPLLKRIISALGDQSVLEHSARQNDQLRALDYIYHDPNAPNFVADAPQWADRLIDANREIIDLRQALARANAPLEHDDYLRDQFHELLTHATSLLSISNVLNTHGNIPAETNAQFRELNESEAQHLSVKLRALMHHLEKNEAPIRSDVSPDRLIGWLRADSQNLDRLHELAQEPMTPKAIRAFAAEHFGDHDHSWFLCALVERFARDLHGVQKDMLIDLPAIDHNLINNLAREQNIELDRALRLVALASLAKAKTKIALGIDDRTGHKWLRPLMNRLAMEPDINCAFWPQNTANAAADGLQSQDLVIDDGAQMMRVIAAQGQWGALGTQPIQMTSYLIIDITEDDHHDATPIIAGLNCQNCANLECQFRRNFASIQEESDGVQ